MEFKQDKLAHTSTIIVIDKAAKLPHGQFQAVLSTETLDRHGEIVSVQGMELPKNQVVKMYYNHQTTGDALPIGKWLKIWKTKDNQLMGQGEIDLNDPFAAMVYSKIQNGFIDSISIGFYPKEFDGDTSTWTKSQLVEASVVAEPANTDAKITSKQLGFTEQEFEKTLKVKLAEVKQPEEKMTVQRIVKGAVMDVLVEKDKWEVLCDSDFWDVIYAFEDAYFADDVPSSDFTKLLQETINILQTIVDGTYQDPDDNEENGASPQMTEMQAAIEELKSKQGALEAAVKAANDNPAINQLIRVRVAGKQVDQAAEELNRVIKVTLKENS